MNMGTIVVAPLGKIAELAVRHRCREMGGVGGAQAVGDGER